MLRNEDTVTIIEALASARLVSAQQTVDYRSVGYLLLVFLSVALPSEQACHKALPTFGHLYFLGPGLLANGRGLIYARGRRNLTSQRRRLDVRQRLWPG